MSILASTLQTLKGSKRQRRGRPSLAASETSSKSGLSSSLSAPSLSDASSSSSLSTSTRPQTGYIFREPIIANDMDDTPATAHRRMVAIVLYNLALAHHLHGLRVQDGDCTKTASRMARFHLQTSQSMYEMCLKVQIKHGFDLGDFYKLLVLPNNIGQAAMALGKTQSARGYMTFLAKQLDQFLQQSNDESSNFPHRENAIEEFLHNTTRLNPFGATQVVSC
ncbi:MAG: hypothetical protein SGBAC_006420 [Bacillariaceae sp.]